MTRLVKFTAVCAVVAAAANFAYASDKVPCTKDEYDIASSLAKKNGYSWNGDGKSCVKQNGFNNILIFPTDRVVAGTIYLVVDENPLRFQMMNEYASELFCAMMENGKIVNVGRKCRR